MHFTWDSNEWYVVLLSLFALIAFIRVRKHFRLSVILMVWLYTVTYISTLDYALAATPFNVYYCGDNDTYEPIAIVAYTLMYTPFSFIFLYLYDKWDIHGSKLALYLAGWACFAIGFEWLNLQIGFLVYKQWKLVYSIPSYPISCLFLIQVYRFIMRNLPKVVQSR